MSLRFSVRLGALLKNTRPIFAAARCNCAELRSAIGEQGCFVLTGLFDPATIAVIRERAEFVGRAWDYMVEHGYTKDIQDYLSGAFTGGHLPETHIDPVRTWAELTAASPFDEIATSVFGGTTRGYALRRSTLNGNPNPLPFHQDAFFIGSEPWFNFWTPLQDCGTDAPGLEVVIGSGSPILKHSAANDVTVRSDVAGYVERRYGPQSYWAPELKAGDVLVFTSMMFHRTQFAPQFTKMRYSLELRGAIKDRTLAIADVPADWNAVKMLDDIPA